MLDVYLKHSRLSLRVSQIGSLTRAFSQIGPGIVWPFPQSLINLYPYGDKHPLSHIWKLVKQWAIKELDHNCSIKQNYKEM